MTYPILAKSLLSLSLLAATLPAGGASLTALPDDSSVSVSAPAGHVTVTRTVATSPSLQLGDAAKEGAYSITAAEGTPSVFSITLKRGDEAGDVLIRSSLAAISDPLELAKQYAPDTVEEWTKTLEQLKEKVKPQVFSIQVAKPAGEAGGEVALQPVEIAVRPAPAASPEDGTASVEDITVQPVQVEIRQAVVLEEGAANALPSTTVPSEVKVFPLNEDIIKAQNTVAKALEAGDTEAVRAGLQELLAAYRAFLTQN